MMVGCFALELPVCDICAGESLVSLLGPPSALSPAGPGKLLPPSFSESLRVKVVSFPGVPGHQLTPQGTAQQPPNRPGLCEQACTRGPRGTLAPLVFLTFF